MNSLLVVVKSHLFLALVHSLSIFRERGKVAAVTTSGYWGERHQAGRRQSIAMGGLAIGREAVAVTHNLDSQYSLGRGARLGLG